MKKQGSGIRDQESEDGWSAPSSAEPRFSRPAANSNRDLGLALILAAAAIAVAPQVVWGNSCGHDFDFHLVSWLDALNAWRHGIVYPHWTPSANYGAGEPRFVFYSPLTWMLGAALGAVIPWSAVPVVMTFLLLAGTGLATRALARDGVSESAATLAGCIVVFSGYALFTAYERSAFAELAGGVWIPLVLKYALRERLRSTAVAVERALWRSIFNGSMAPLAIAIAGSWLSNPTVGVMACYTLAAIGLVMIVFRRSWQTLIRVAAGATLGLGLVAIYVLPAAFEQRWVDIHQVTEDPGQTLENNWLFAQHADPSLALHDQVLHTASIIVVEMLTLTFAALLVCWLRRRLPYTRASGSPSWWIPLAPIPVAVLLLQFPLSRPVWNLLPDLRFLQFPWRWLLVLEPVMAIFVSAALWPRRSEPRSPRIVVGAACAAACIAITASAARDLYQPCESDDAVPGMLRAYRSGQGFAGTFEYEPIGADISTTAMNLPEACLVSNPKVELGKPNQNDDMVWAPGQGTCDATYSSASSNPEHLRISATIPKAGFLVLRLLSYPARQVKVNGHVADSLTRRDDGLIVAPVPAGPVVVTADWTITPDVKLARWLSVLAVLALTAVGLLEQKLNRPRL